MNEVSSPGTQLLAPPVSADRQAGLTLVMANNLEQLAMKLNYTFDEVADFLTHCKENEGYYPVKRLWMSNLVQYI